MSAVGIDPRLADGRQSPTALAVARGTGRLLVAGGFAVLHELPLISGRRADLVAVALDGEVWIVEVKSSREDFHADRKWPDYLAHCDRFFFAAPLDLDPAIFPLAAGLIVADAHGAEILREGAVRRMAAATRKAVTLRFARAAASRLHALWDPAARTPEF
jgi:hypothetical protein